MRGRSVEFVPLQKATRFYTSACQPSPQSGIRPHLPQVIDRKGDIGHTQQSRQVFDQNRRFIVFNYWSHKPYMHHIELRDQVNRDFGEEIPRKKLNVMRKPGAGRTLRQTYVEAGQACCRRKRRCKIEEPYSDEWNRSASAALQMHDGNTSVDW